MNVDEAVAAARFEVKHGHYVEPEVVGVLLSELDARGVAIERVREWLDQNGLPLGSENVEFVTKAGALRVLDGRP